MCKSIKVSDDHVPLQASKAAGSGKLQITGNLTIHGTTKEVVLEVDGPTAPIKDPMGKGQRMGASATTKVNRQDFGVATMPEMIGDDITITIDAMSTAQARSGRSQACGTPRISGFGAEFVKTRMAERAAQRAFPCYKLQIWEHSWPRSTSAKHLKARFRGRSTTRNCVLQNACMPWSWQDEYSLKAP
jgi:hypothetical protein